MAVDEDMRRRIFYTGRPTTVRATDAETTTRADGVTHSDFQHKV